jgi:PAS domain S-box-containing protein
MLLRTVGRLSGPVVKLFNMKPGADLARRPVIRRRIAMASCAGALLTAGVLGALLMKLRSDEVTEATNLLTAVAQLTDEQTSRTLQNVEQGVQNVQDILAGAERRAARAAASASYEAEAFASTTESIDGQLHKLALNRPYLSVIRVLDRQGRAIYNSDTGQTGLDLSDREYFTERRIRPEMRFAFGVPIQNRLAAKWIIPATQTLYAANADFAGVIVAAVDPLFFNRVWTLDRAIPTLSVALFRADGMMLMRSPVDERLIGKSYSSGYIFRQVGAGVSTGSFQNKSAVDGNMRLFVYRQLALYPGLVLVVNEAMEQVLEPWRQMVWIIVPSWIVAMLAMGGLTVWLTREWERRRDTQDRYQQMFNASPYPTIALDAATRRFLAINDAAIEQYGWSREEALTMCSDDLYPPEDLIKIRDMRKTGPIGIVKAIEGLRHHKKDGTIIDVAMTLRPVELDGRPGFLATAEDITERLAGRKARLASDAAREASDKARSVTEAQLRQSQKMEAVGQLTGGIAHDFNNILMVILANADELQEDKNLDAATLAERIGLITDAVLRASGLTRQLLAFSRQQPLDPKRTDLNDLVSDTGKLLRRALGEQVEIDSVLPVGLWTINIDRTQIETALVNLCVNARDAMPGGGKLSIETRNVSLSKDTITQATDVAPGDYVMLSVTDTGSGMPPETVARIFEPFFTTKEVGKGTGLGLSMVYGFIKQSHGHITVHSEVGHGTTFKLYLPRSDGAQEEAAVRPTTALPRGHERILVVEDELQVRASVVKQLQSLGYAVAEAAHGEAAIEILETARLPYDLLLTDVVMPGPLGGRALADEVLRRWPATKIVFVSGYAENAVLHDGQADEGVVLLSKPFRKSDLARTVREALGTAVEPPSTLPKVA